MRRFVMWYYRDSSSSFVEPVEYGYGRFFPFLIGAPFVGGLLGGLVGGALLAPRPNFYPAPYPVGYPAAPYGGGPGYPPYGAAQAPYPYGGNNYYF